MTSLIWVAVALLLCLAGQTIQMTTCEPASSTPPPPSPQPVNKIQLGPFSMEMYANITRNQDKLRFSKGFYKFVTRNSPLLGSKPLISHKISYIGEFVRCENLTETIAQLEVEPSIECRPLESYLSSRSTAEMPPKTTSRVVLYAHRYIFRLKGHSWWQEFFGTGDDKGGVKRRTTMRAYALRPEMIHGELEATLTRLKLLEPTDGRTAADFFGPNQQVAGLYLEASGEADCSAKLFMAVNASGVSTASANYPDESLSSLFAASAAGLIISLNEFSCKQSNGLMSLDQNFDMVIQQRFPYLSVRHEIGTSPLAQLVKYLGTVEQLRDPSGGYNTSISMSSGSALFEGLNFELEQTFVNEPDGKSGWEAMRLLHLQLGLATVDARWTGASLVKQLRLFGGDIDIDQLVDNMAALVLAYRDEPAEDPDHVSLTFKINRHLLAGFLTGIRHAQAGITTTGSHDEL